MKNLYKFLILGISVLVTACEKDPISEEQMSQYRSIYMKDAELYPKPLDVFIQDEEQSLSFNANLGGYGDNDQNIQVTFEIRPDLVDEFNTEKGTDYEVLPAEAYEAGDMEATISPGNLYSELLSITLTTKGHMTPGSSYLLPVGIKSVSGNGDVPVNESLRVAYYLLKGAYPLGEEPPTQVFNLAAPTISAFTYGNLFTIVRSSDNRIAWFPYSDATESFGSEAGSDGDWGVLFNQIMPYTGRYIVRWNNCCGTNGTLRTYSVTPSGVASNGLNIGTGFEIYNLMTTSVFHNIVFGRNAAGELMAYPYSTGQIMPHNEATNLGTGWDAYTQIIGYADGLLALEADGELWYFPITMDEGTPVLGTKKLVGTGWNIYNKIIAFGSDLLGRDSAGVIWKYNFDTRAVWALPN